jgi:hypothetical protein
MKRLVAAFLVLSLVLLSAGCAQNKTRVAEGTAAGGILGAAAGAGIGSLSGNAGAGAGIGALVGAATGALIGSQINKPGQPAAAAGTQPAQGATTAAAPQSQGVNPNQMSIQQIVDFTKQGINEDVIIDKIRLTNSKFSLTADDVASLKQQGVSPNVIKVMQGL